MCSFCTQYWWKNLAVLAVFNTIRWRFLIVANFFIGGEPCIYIVLPGVINVLITRPSDEMSNGVAILPSDDAKRHRTWKRRADFFGSSARNKISAHVRHTSATTRTELQAQFTGDFANGVRQDAAAETAQHGGAHLCPDAPDDEDVARGGVGGTSGARALRMFSSKSRHRRVKTGPNLVSAVWQLQPKVVQTAQQHASYKFIWIRRTCDYIFQRLCSRLTALWRYI